MTVIASLPLPTEANYGVAGRKDTFMWRIEGFSSLDHHSGASCASRPFMFGGYSWKLKIFPKYIDRKSGQECMSLYLCLENASSLPLDLVLNIGYEMCVYDQLHKRHQIYTGESYFRRQAGGWGFHNIILHGLLKHSASGFLLNDTCNASVKFLKFGAQKADCSNMFERLSLQEKPAAQMFTWKIENFTELPRPHATSMNFVAGGHNWDIRVYPDGTKKCRNYLGIYLKLETTRAMPFKSELYVEYSLSLLDQINGHHKKHTAKNRFSTDARRFGFIKFLPLEDFKNPLKGFLVENACVIEASVMVLGSSTMP